MLFPRSAAVVGAEYLSLAGAEIYLARINLVDGYAESGWTGAGIAEITRLGPMPGPGMPAIGAGILTHL